MQQLLTNYTLSHKYYDSLETKKQSTEENTPADGILLDFLSKQVAIDQKHIRTQFLYPNNGSDLAGTRIWLAADLVFFV